MNTKLRFNFINFILAALIFFFPMIVFWIMNRPIYVWLEAILVLVCMIKYQRFYPINAKSINLILISTIFSAVSALLANLPSDNQKTAVVQVIYAIIAYFAVSYVFHMIKSKPMDTLSLITRAFKTMLLVELFWIPLQYICYHVFSLDINDLIFVKTLHMVEDASFVRSWIWYPSGLSWHSAILAPMFVVGLFIFDELWIKALIVADALICGNSTTVIGVVLAVIMMLLSSLTKKKQIRTRTIVISLLILIIGSTAAYRFGMFEKIQEQFLYTFARILSGEEDDSTAAHLGYFTDYFDVVKQSDPLQIIFGYGVGNSGYPIWKLNGRQTDLTSWAVECDFVDLLVSRGIFGFVAYYSFLLYIAIKGRKVDKRYTMTMLAIIIEGLGYNVQWAYVFFIEMIFLQCIRDKTSFFDIALETKIIGKRKNKYESLDAYGRGVVQIDTE